MKEECAMFRAVRCDHCDVILGDDRIERHRKRFCCADCARAYDRGDLKAISPHRHGAAPEVAARQPAGVRS